MEKVDEDTIIAALTAKAFPGRPAVPQADVEKALAALKAKCQEARRCIDAEQAAQQHEKFTYRRDAAPACAGGPEAHAGEAPALLNQAPSDDRWPAPCAPAAFHGLAGEVVRTIAPHSEADPVALLVQFLTAFGNCMGRGPHWKVGQDKHYSNLFCLLVGRSPKNRKGASWDAILNIFPESWRARITPELPDAENMFRQVRDLGGADSLPDDERGQAGRPPVRDRRLMLVESEFGPMLRQLGRPDNAWTPLLRQAWKHGSLEFQARNGSTQKATGAHISLIGHVSQRELQRRLSATGLFRGLDDHFLWVCVKRAQLLPLGGQIPDEELARLSAKVQAAVDFAAGVREIKRDAEADKLWCELYPKLSSERAGLAATVCGRAEAQVMRLAMLYALLDRGTGILPVSVHGLEGRATEAGGTPAIRPCHLESAVALWRYCEESACCLFGETLGDKLAENLAAVLRRHSEGLTRRDISNYYMRNKPATEIRHALALLWRAGVARFEKQNSKGRPTERWFYCESGYELNELTN